MTMKNSNNLWE